MTIKTSKISGRRELRFTSLDEVTNDAEQIVSMSHRTLGNWNSAQILEHLAIAMHAAFDGGTFRAPWFARTLIAPFLKKQASDKSLPAGFSLPKSAASLIPSSATNLNEALEDLRRAVNRFKTEIPDKPHPFLGKLTPAEMVQLHLRHSELHLSFIVPEEGS